MPRLVASTGVPARYLACRFENFQPSGRQPLLEALSVARRYVDEFLRPDGSFAAAGLLFQGMPGTGKTHLACAVLLELVRRYSVHGRFVDFTSLIHQIQSTFDAGAEASKSEVLEPVIGAEVLVLDELGVQKPTPWASDVLYLILNTRYSRRLPTIFTSNYRLEAVDRSAPLDRPAGAAGVESLGMRIPAQLVSRLHEMATPVDFDAPDFRQTVKSARFPRSFAS